MKAKIILLLFLVLSAMADDIVISTSAHTNLSNGVKTKAVFTRAGVTNLVCETTIKDGEMFFRRQSVFHKEQLALDIIEMDSGITWSTGTNLAFTVGTHLTVDGKLDNVNLMGPDVVTLDHFSVTNGLLNPISFDEIKKANDIGQDMKVLFNQENVRNSTKEEFLGQALEFIEKHKSKDE